MNIKDLKRLARYMQPDMPVDIEDGEVWYMHYLPTTGEGIGVKILATQYSPLENAEQDRELDIKFEITTTRISDGLWQANCGKLGVFEGRGKTPLEACFNAAIAAINE